LEKSGSSEQQNVIQPVAIVPPSIPEADKQNVIDEPDIKIEDSDDEIID
tara:strand:+ start:148 stop:294 length:147 start_codon:yes stop_codon:yes gene_type:complete